jgi:rubrerythrin
VTRPAGALAALHAARREEKLQALFYRSLAVQAEEAGAVDDAERLNGLLADEQHHLSRLSARLLELGEPLADVARERAPESTYAGWEDVARQREDAEIARYARLLESEWDAQTAAMLAGFLDVERRHREVLGGKWMNA